MLSDKFSQALPYNVSATFLSGEDPKAGSPLRSTSTLDAIKAYILANKLHPGDPLPTEAALCAQLNVSRSSVREALRKLEALDIVSVHQGRGSVVGNMTLQPLVDTLLLKNAIETKEGNRTLHDIASTRFFLDLGIAKELTTAMKGTTNPYLRELIAEMTLRAERGELFFEADIAFHQGLMEYLENPLLEELMSAMWFIHQQLFSNLPSEEGAGSDSLLATARAHGDMLDAAEAGDVLAYIHAVNEHYMPLQDLIRLSDAQLEMVRELKESESPRKQ
ncbi:MAG: GntR family transcriptional regulator [Actinomycetaceae bacterium]|nr:GntR family transcriptional regulator [Arcanobacterium sp.]MDD7504579.1 GntR family transcriptional regulator [Actinomycetaceae bacterium]MDY6143222.1 GntR family transcriptional regulator [Arcanobacterium sp.]